LGRIGLIALVLALLIGSVAAFTRTEKLKLEPAPITKPRFDRHLSPTCDCRHADSRLSFLLKRPERLDVSIVDSDGGHVATLAEGWDRNAGRVGVRWDGRDDGGSVAPDGSYRLKVRLERDRRTILIPRTIVVDTVAPRVELVGLARGDGIGIRYRSSEAGRPLLLVDGKRVARGARQSRGTRRFEWDGSLGSGAHEIAVALVDRAGNRSEPTEPILVAGS
jgi:hypothetical protein